MFEGEAYRSYVALCREMRLARSMVPGDWYASNHRGDVPTVVGEHQGLDARTPLYEDDSDYVWLPRLDQLLDMLDAAGFPYVEVWRCGGSYSRPMYVCGGALDGEEPPQDYTRSAGRWPTREDDDVGAGPVVPGKADPRRWRGKRSRHAEDSPPTVG